MFSSLAVISALTTAAWAQSSTANPLIPSGISSSCSNFLNTFNSDSTLLSCTQSLVQATANYGPGGNSTSSPTASSMSTALTSICSSSTECDASKVRSALSNFYSSCGSELTSNKNTDVVRTYDVLYALVPMREAVCSKDDSGKWCVTQTSTSTSSSSVSASVALSNKAVDNGKVDLNTVQEYLYSTGSSSLSKRADAIYPNMTTFSSSNLPFLFISPDMSYAELCTTCTRNVLTAYIDWESATPYAPGLTNSPMLNTQTALYNGILSTCGNSFLSGAVQAAGSLSDGSSNSGFKTLRFDAQSMIATLLGVTTMTMLAFF